MWLTMSVATSIINKVRPNQEVNSEIILYTKIVTRNVTNYVSS